MTACRPVPSAWLTIALAATGLLAAGLLAAVARAQDDGAAAPGQPAPAEQAPEQPAPQQSAPEQPAQMPPIGIIDYYGLETLTPARVEPLLPFRLGDSPVDDAELSRAEERIAGGFGVPSASIDIVCCDAGRSIAYVGVEDRPFTHPDYRPDPEGVIELPDSVLERSARFDAALREAVLNGDASEDWSQGHALENNAPEVRAIQEEFVEYARGHVGPLRRVLAESHNAGHRAIAANLIAYAPDKAAIVPDLEAAVLDGHPGVRNNATRALAVIAVYANAHPELGITIVPDPFVDMLNSGDWSDRNKGMLVLTSLTVSRDPALLEQLKAKSLPALIEMCRWQSDGHSRMACLLLERVVGLPERQEPYPKEQTIALASKLL